MRPKTTSSIGAAQTRPRRGLGWRSPLKICLFTPPTTLRRLHSVPDGRKLDHGGAASGKSGSLASCRTPALQKSPWGAPGAVRVGTAIPRVVSMGHVPAVGVTVSVAVILVGVL